MTGYAKTALLLAGLTALFLGAGFLVGGQGGLLIALVLALGMNLFAYWNSDSLVLRMYGAKQVGADSHPRLFRLVEQLAARGDLPMPKVYVMENAQPNAFATGRNPQNAAVAVTSGLMNQLSEAELAGVIGHELAHIKNRDTLIMTITATIAGALGMLANFALFFGGRRDSPLGPIGSIAVMILAPLAAMLVQMAISRSREYEADRVGAEIAGNPLWLAAALDKIAGGAARIDNVAAENNPATAHLFIINPLHAHKRDNLFSTHPSTANRIARLEAMASGVSGSSYQTEERRGARRVRPGHLPH